jgi:hypothetical protein
MEGAVDRLGPKMLTVVSTIGGLLPLMWASGAGAATMQRIAAPKVGGLLTSAALTLIVIPVVYAGRREWQMPAGDQTDAVGWTFRPGKPLSPTRRWAEDSDSGIFPTHWTHRPTKLESEAETDRCLSRSMSLQDPRQPRLHHAQSLVVLHESTGLISLAAQPSTHPGPCASTPALCAYRSTKRSA